MCLFVNHNNYKMYHGLIPFPSAIGSGTVLSFDVVCGHLWFIRVNGMHSIRVLE